MPQKTLEKVTPLQLLSAACRCRSGGCRTQRGWRPRRSTRRACGARRPWSGRRSSSTARHLRTPMVFTLRSQPMSRLGLRPAGDTGPMWCYPPRHAVSCLQKNLWQRMMWPFPGPGSAPGSASGRDCGASGRTRRAGEAAAGAVARRRARRRLHQAQAGARREAGVARQAALAAAEAAGVAAARLGGGLRVGRAARRARARADVLQRRVALLQQPPAQRGSSFTARPSMHSTPRSWHMRA